MGRASKYSPELCERAVRLVFDHTPEHPSQWAAIRSIADKLGCRVESLRRWVRQAERDAGKRPGLTTTEREELKRTFIDPHRDTTESNRFVRFCLSLRRRISGARRSSRIRHRGRLEPDVMRISDGRFGACGTSTSRCTGPGGCGGSCGVKASASPDAPSSV